MISAAPVISPAAAVRTAFISATLWGLRHRLQRVFLTNEVLRDDESHNRGVPACRKDAGRVDLRPQTSARVHATTTGGHPYLAIATTDFAAYWFPDGLRAPDLARAPMVAFDGKDTILSALIRRHTRAAISPPTTYIPGSRENRTLTSLLIDELTQLIVEAAAEYLV